MTGLCNANVEVDARDDEGEERHSTLTAHPLVTNFACYLLVTNLSSRTYIGATVLLSRRIRQHNGELAGGAKATRRFRPWRVKAICTGFDSWREALRFEWRWKRKSLVKWRSDGRRGADQKVKRAMELCGMIQFQHVRLTVHELL